MTFDRMDPVAGAVAPTSPAMAVAEAIAAAFPAWSALGPNARRAALNRAADGLKARAAEFVAAMMVDPPTAVSTTKQWSTRSKVRISVAAPA